MAYALRAASWSQSSGCVEQPRTPVSPRDGATGGGGPILPVFTRRLRGEQGFTLIELLIVVAIIAILAAILIPNFLRARAQAQVASDKGNLKNIATALESYFVDFAQYPQDPTTLMASYTRALPSDPCTGGAFGTASGGYIHPGRQPSERLRATYQLVPGG